MSQKLEFPPSSRYLHTKMLSIDCTSICPTSKCFRKGFHGYMTIKFCFISLNIPGLPVHHFKKRNCCAEWKYETVIQSISHLISQSSSQIVSVVLCVHWARPKRREKIRSGKMSGSVRTGCWWFGAVPEKLDRKPVWSAQSDQVQPCYQSKPKPSFM